MEYAICIVSAAPVRKEPSHRSEMTNQLLFGETMQVLEIKEEWFCIRSLYDGYEGWLTHHLIKEVGEGVARSELSFATTGLVNPVVFMGGLINVPMGSSLTGFNEETGALWDEQHTYKGNYRNINRTANNNLLEKIVQTWLNAPYLWGGRTFMGVDCSGFCQVIFKMLGIKLKRDAYQQAEEGEKVDNLEAAKKGDLAFFQNAEGRVIHVGILLDKQSIIHASGKVRIDRIDEKGITNSENERRTHFLHSMKRYF